MIENMGLIFLLVVSSLAVQGSDFRTWSDVSGKFKIEAKFSSLENGTLILEKKDGKRVKIPLTKLSTADQAQANKLAADSNPFQALDDSGTQADSGNSTSGTPESSSGLKTVQTNWQAVDNIELQASGWDVSFSDPIPFGFRPKVTTLPKKVDFFEGITGVSASLPSKRAALSHIRGRDDQQITRVVLLDMETAQMIRQVEGPGKWTVQALHDDGEQMVVKNESTRDSASQLGTIRLVGKKIQALDVWEPYQTQDEKGRGSAPQITTIEFIGANQLMTCNDAGNLVIWDFEKREPLFRCDIPRTGFPCVSPDRKYIAFSGGDKVCLLNLQSRQVTAIAETPGMNFWCRTCFSPSGRYLAASSQQKTFVLDSGTGAVLFSGDFPGVSPAFGLHFPHEDFLLLSNDYLVEWQSGIKVWTYKGSNYTAKLGAFPAFCILGDASAFIPFPLPHQEALDMLEKAKKQDDLFILKQGVDIAIDVTNVPENYRANVSSMVAQQIESLGCNQVANGPLTLKVSVVGPVNERISYFRAGDFDFNKYTTTVSFLYQGKPVWATNASNMPGVLTSMRDKSYQQQIDEAGRSPYIDFVGKTVLPRFLQKPSENTPTNGAQNIQTLGLSTITPTGLK